MLDDGEVTQAETTAAPREIVHTGAFDDEGIVHEGESGVVNRPGDSNEASSREHAAWIADAADDTRALEIVTLDLRGLTLVADFFVICSGTSDVHVRSISDRIEETLKKQHKVRPFAVQGRQDANWIVLDYGDVVAHVFSEEEREYYDLESFWQNAKVVERVLSARPSR